MEGAHLIPCILEISRATRMSVSTRCLGAAVSELLLQTFYLKISIEAEPGTVHLIVNFY